MSAKRKKTTRRNNRNKTNPIDVYMGGRVKHYRRKRSMTPVELADEINVTADQINKYEKGITRMSDSTIVKIRDALSCHIFDLFGKYADTGDETVKGLHGKRIMAVLKCHKKMNDGRAEDKTRRAND